MHDTPTIVARSLGFFTAKTQVVFIEIRRTSDNSDDLRNGLARFVCQYVHQSCTDDPDTKHHYCGSRV